MLSTFLEISLKIFYEQKKVSQKEKKRCHTLIIYKVFRSQIAPVSKPNSIEDPPCLGALCKLNLTWAKRPSAGVVRKYGEGQLGCRPRHLTTAQNYKARHKSKKILSAGTASLY
ncbi:hypothetical protein AVEN_24410-1 [Araneus ventricosus]|uniref:Uncharacterized protein n=1 Tax=Araneus ventricosus TaxID=182803 RepID=A0A4Y2NR18_ARAVE|nr:hypothetical protein AVEN_149714-1 [Araneus ventricosus]GBN41162.1 hypothetical protein AVEN_81673-1 [Araneus ventricosus]GBN57284.1 hypothetical protein AVEN_24410-1 [Araneus ventricosus]